MANLVQVNVRAPEDAKALITAVAARLRHDAAFRLDLERLLEAPEHGGLSVADRISKLELAVEALQRRIGAAVE